MIVDDDHGMVTVLAQLLAEWGYGTLPFDDFEHARASILNHVPDALIVDIRLGEYNGLQLTHLARQRSADIIVVAMSGFDDQVLRAEAARAGAAYFVKPFEPRKLRQHLDDAFEARRQAGG